MRRAHPAAAAAGDGFDHHRVTDFLRDLDRLLFVSTMPSLPGVTGTPALRAQARAEFLSPIARIALRRRPDELDFAALADFGEVRVLGQKSVAGMNRIDVADFGRAHDAIDLQITFRARRRADADRFVRQLDVQRIDVRLGINREGANAEFFAGANDAQRNFAAIGDQNFFEHQL